MISTSNQILFAANRLSQSEIDGCDERGSAPSFATILAMEEALDADEGAQDLRHDDERDGGSSEN